MRISEKELKRRWMNAEAHLKKQGWICPHGIEHTKDAYCRKCLKQSVL